MKAFCRPCHASPCPRESIAHPLCHHDTAGYPTHNMSPALYGCMIDGHTYTKHRGRSDRRQQTPPPKASYTPFSDPLTTFALPTHAPNAKKRIFFVHFQRGARGSKPKWGWEKKRKEKIAFFLFLFSSRSCSCCIVYASAALLSGTARANIFSRRPDTFGRPVLYWNNTTGGGERPRLC